MTDDVVSRASPTAEVEDLVRELIDEIRVLKGRVTALQGRVTALEGRPLLGPPYRITSGDVTAWAASSSSTLAGGGPAASSVTVVELAPDAMLFAGGAS